MMHHLIKDGAVPQTKDALNESLKLWNNKHVNNRISDHNIGVSLIFIACIV